MRWLSLLASVLMLASVVSAELERRVLSFVVLLDAPRDLSRKDFERAVEAAWGAEAAKRADYRVVTEVNGVLIGLDDRIFLVINSRNPYWNPEDFDLEEVGNLRTRRVLIEQKAWFSVDLFGEENPPDEPEVWKRLGSLAAELAKSRQPVGLYSPDAPEPVDWVELTTEQLQGDEPLLALARDDAVVLPPDPAAMEAAIRRAQETFPEFTEAFHAKAEGTHSFVVKYPITTGEDVEHIWAEVLAIDGATIRAALANEPVYAKHLKPRDEVTIDADDISDWLYIKGEEMVGGFTIKALEPSPTEPADDHQKNQ